MTWGLSFVICIILELIYILLTFNCYKENITRFCRQTQQGLNFGALGQSD